MKVEEKPLVYDAIQFNGRADDIENMHDVDRFVEVWQHLEYFRPPGKGLNIVLRLEAGTPRELEAKSGDWLIKNEIGKVFKIVDNEAFKAFYREVNDV